jgi:hypothetical protein
MEKLVVYPFIEEERIEFAEHEGGLSSLVDEKGSGRWKLRPPRSIRLVKLALRMTVASAEVHPAK